VVEGARPEHLGAVIDALEQAGVELCVEPHAVRVRSCGLFRPVDITPLMEQP